MGRTLASRSGSSRLDELRTTASSLVSAAGFADTQTGRQGTPYLRVHVPGTEHRQGLSYPLELSMDPRQISGDCSDERSVRTSNGLVASWVWAPGDNYRGPTSGAHCSLCTSVSSGVSRPGSGVQDSTSSPGASVQANPFGWESLRPSQIVPSSYRRSPAGAHAIRKQPRTIACGPQPIPGIPLVEGPSSRCSGRPHALLST
eukprot:scaffold1134_cov295-Prasinococcus_capsulatus_cf.AAC.9